MSRAGAEAASAVECLARHQAHERGPLAKEVDVAVDQDLERRAQLAGALEQVRRGRGERPQALLAFGEQALEDGAVEAFLAAEEIRRQRRGGAGAPADLAEARAVVSARGEELLGGVEDRAPRGLRVAPAARLRGTRRSWLQWYRARLDNFLCEQ